MVFVVHDASPRAKITFEAAIALSQHGTVAPVTIHHRTLFASSMIDGRTAMELEPNGQSAVEVAGLWEYVNARLNFQVVPTAIGLDAMNRRDGQNTAKQPFAAPNSAPLAAPLEAHFEQPFEEHFEEAYEPVPNAEPAVQTPSLVQVKPVERVPDPVPREFSQPRASANLWEGFEGDGPHDRAATRANAHPQNGVSTHATPRVFGRRHASA